MKKRLIHSWGIAIIVFIVTSCSKKEEQNYDNMIIRISEIQIDPKYLKEYIAILKEEAEASVRLENGVIAIYPMFQKKQANEIRILEIYASKDAYEAHLKTPHFQHYKTSTLKMVNSLNLVDMNALDSETMPTIFKKLNL
jgi:quinol monooxygenase YgiN